MKTYHARDILKMSLQDVWDVDNHKVKLIFDDGELETSWRATIISRYTWWPHKSYPDIPLLVEHHLGNDRVHRGTFAKLTTKVLQQVLIHYRETLDKEAIMRGITREMNRIYNDFTYHLPEYITSINALDLAEVMYHPEIFELNEKAEPNHHSITNTHEQIRAKIRSADFLPKNQLLEEIRSGTVNMQQSMQVLSIRGFVTDIDGLQFSRPIMRGFAHGISSITELAQESRSASKALYYQTDPLKDTEYFNRRLQLLLQSIKHLYKGDCGTKETIPWYVSAKDMDVLVGINYLDEETNTFVPIEDTKAFRQKIVDKKIQLRMPFLCHKLGHAGVCEKCYGELRHSLPNNTNVGHFAAIEVGGTISQATLSVKHNDYSVEVSRLKLDDTTALYLEYTGDDDNQLKLLEKLLKNAVRIELHLRNNEVIHLNDIEYYQDISELTPSNLTSIQNVDIVIEKKDGTTILDYISIANKSRKAYLTYEFLNHVKQVGFSAVGSKSISIDVTHWNFTKPVFELPLRRESTLDFMKNFASNIETQYGKANLNINNPAILAKTLFNTYDISNSYVKLHLTHIATILAAIMIRDRENQDYRLPLKIGQRQFVTANEAIHNRSISTTMAYEEQHVVLTDPISYLGKNRVSHPFDNIIFPSVGNIYRDYESWKKRKKILKDELKK